MADFTIDQGQTLPIFEDTLSYSNGKLAEPESVKFVMRSPTGTEPLNLKGTAAVVTKAAGTVSFTPSASDTAVPGNYLANWEAKIAGSPMTFPTEGDLWVQVQPSLTASEAMIVGLPEVKDHLFLPSTDHTHDATLERFIKGVRPLIENLTGPILPTTYDEWYEGGHSTIALRHVPSYGYGASPIFVLMAVSEYRGPIEYNLSLVPTPTQGSVYSTMGHGELGTIVRRTAGGGTYAFWSDPSHPQQSVHVVYHVGQEQVPENVNMAAIETIRWWFETTQAVGRGSLAAADNETMRPMVALPYHAEAMLAPTRRPPVCA